MAVERLEAMVSTTDGFELAERDLEIRGEGQLVGARQSGLTDLRFTRLRADRDLLERAKELARPARGERRSSTPSSGSSARRSTSASRRSAPRDADHRRNRTGAGGSRRRRARHTRPTGDRVREALFNLVGPVDGASVLDLYAGSGALGLEALSRGARRCVFVETDRAACRAIRANLETLGLTGGLVDAARRAGACCARSAPPADATSSCSSTHPTSSGRSSSRGSPSCCRGRRRAGIVVVETDARAEPTLPLDLVTTRRYGSARLTLFAP